MYSPSLPESPALYISLISSLWSKLCITLNWFWTAGIISYFHSCGINGKVSNHDTAIQTLNGEEALALSRTRHTVSGGDILPIEVNYYEGNSNLILTGSMGEVMLESAKIALSYIKANSKLFDIDYKKFNNLP